MYKVTYPSSLYPPFPFQEVGSYSKTYFPRPFTGDGSGVGVNDRWQYIDVFETAPKFSISIHMPEAKVDLY